MTTPLRLMWNMVGCVDAKPGKACAVSRLPCVGLKPALGTGEAIHCWLTIPPPTRHPTLNQRNSQNERASQYKSVLHTPWPGHSDSTVKVDEVEG